HVDGRERPHRDACAACGARRRRSRHPDQFHEIDDRPCDRGRWRLGAHCRRAGTCRAGAAADDQSDDPGPGVRPRLRAEPRPQSCIPHGALELVRVRGTERRACGTASGRDTPMTGATVLLTGTGTIGREVLLALLRRTDSRVAVLMRDRGRRPAAQRVDALAAALALTPAERARVDLLRGDITARGFGLDAGVQGRLATSVELFVHTAATTSL